jgi:ABC-2 type transport system permease protein
LTFFSKPGTDAAQGGPTPRTFLSPAVTLASQINLLRRVHTRAFMARTQGTLRNSKLMCLTIGLFLLAYLVVGYFMFQFGLAYVAGVPGVGLLLLERVVYMVFFFFFSMLVFSNSVLLYSSIFRGKETAWLLTLPLDPRAIFCWKVVESFIMSSWGLAILSAPLLLSIGHTFGAGLDFYLRCILVYIPFMVLPATLSGLAIMLGVRFWGTVGKYLTGGLLLFGIYKLGLGIATARETAALASTMNLSAAMDQLMGHSAVMVNRLLPSTWMGEMVLLWARGYSAHGWFFGLLLLSQSLMLGWICVAGVSRLCYNGWNLSQRRKAMKTGRKRQTTAADGPLEFTGALRLLKKRGPFRRDAAALITKDIREFTRDPAQWVPCVVVFALLFVYAANLNHTAAVDIRQPKFRLILTYLNFGVCCLTLSTLTTRFIFPMFSLEGRRLWILGLAPVGMVRVLRLKLTLFAGVIGTVTCLLMLVSGMRLGMGPAELFVYCLGIVMMSVGLTSLSLGLGVLFPNFTDPSPARVVSGFGGTLCLILNFVYILLFMAVFIIPGFWRLWHPKGSDDPLASWYPWVLGGSVALMALLSLICAGVPYFLSVKRMKRLELLGKL